MQLVSRCASDLFLASRDFDKLSGKHLPPPHLHTHIFLNWFLITRTTFSIEEAKIKKKENEEKAQRKGYQEDVISLGHILNIGHRCFGERETKKR